MNGPWQAHLQLGVVHFMAFPECLGGGGPIVPTLRRLCHDEFFEAVDVGPMNEDADRRESAALLRDCKLTVTFACQPVILREGLDLNAIDREQRKRAVERVVGLIDQARELGVARFGLMSGKAVEPRHQAGALDALVQSLGTICKAARERAGLPVVLEIFDYDMDKKALIGPCSVAADLARQVRRDFADFGLLHDLSHIYLCHETPSKHFPLIREHLVAMHMGSSVSDCGHPLFGDTHPLFGMPGGDCDVAELRDFIKALFDVGFLRAGRRPVCGFEIKPPTGVDPETAIANMKRTWQQAWWGL